MDTELWMVLTTERVMNVKAMLFIYLVLIASAAWAEDLSIIEVRRNIPLSDDEPVYKDYYLSGGASAGLKKDMLVNVTRQINIKDPIAGKEGTHLSVPIGRLRVLFVDESVAVARLYEKQNRDGLPLIEQPGFLIGDRVEIKPGAVDKNPYKFIEDTARAKANHERFAINGELITREIASLGDLPPKMLMPDVEKVDKPVDAGQNKELPMVASIPEAVTLPTQTETPMNPEQKEKSTGPEATIRQ